MFAMTLGIALAAPVPESALAAERYESAIIAAIHLFTRKDEPDHLKALLEKHPRLVNEKERFPQYHKPYTTDGFAPIHWAAREGCARAATVLIENKASLNADSGEGWTALHLAAREGRLDVVKLLVENGAKLDSKTVAQPEREYYAPSPPPGVEQKPIKLGAVPAMTPLDVAVRSKQKAVAEYLKSVAK